MRAKWGQNFLIAASAARRIVAALEAGENDTVLEIGPGRGALTRHLAGRVGRLVAVELDRALAHDLETRGWPGFTVVNEDFLDWPLPDWPANRAKVIGNLPYSAGNAILRKLMDWSGWSEAVVMVQKEVADRIVAAPSGPDYGILSLAVQGKAEARRLFNVPPGAFRPAPKVVSTVLRLRRLAVPLIRREEPFFRVLHAAFGQRRKTLLNSLSHGLELEKAAVAAKLAEAGIDPERRPETVSLEEFNRLTELLEREG